MPAGLRALELCCVLILAGAVAFVLASVGSDPDIWGRIAYARLAWERGELFPTADPYSYTAPGAPWHDHEYGFSWLAFAAEAIAGWSGVRVLGIALFAGALVLSLRPSWRIAPGDPLRLVLYATGLFALGLGFPGPRAQAVSFVLFAWMLFALERSRSRGDWRWILWAALPMPLWANLHGGVLAGIGVLGVWSTFRLIEAVRAKDRPVIIALVLGGTWALVSLLMTPWGIDYPVFLLKTATMPRPFVPEWDAPTLTGARGVLAVLLAAMAVIAAVRQRRPRPEWAILAVVAFAALRHQRHLPFLAIAVLAFAVPELLAWRASRRGVQPDAGTPFAVKLTAAALALLVLGIGALTFRAVASPAPAEPHFPARAMKVLEQEGLRGGLLIDFEWAQYAIHRLPDGVKVAFDGRYEAVYPPEIIDAFMAWNYGHEGWERLPNDARTNLALVDAKSTRAKRLMAMPGWKRVYVDDIAALFTREISDPALGYPPP